MGAEIGTVRVHVTWWLRWYLSSVTLMSQLTGMEPDMGKVGRWVKRGVRLRETRR